MLYIYCNELLFLVGIGPSLCCRHLYNNLRKSHLGVLIRDLLWKAAKAT